MNNKAQMPLIGPLVLVAVAIIIGLAIFTGSVAPSVGQMTISSLSTNTTFTAPAAGATSDLTGQELLSTPVVTNATSGTVITSGSTNNFTIAEGVSTLTGVKTVRLSGVQGPYASRPLNISYSYGGVGYADDQGTRSVIGMIPIMVALAIFAVVFYAIKIEDTFG